MSSYASRIFQQSRSIRRSLRRQNLATTSLQYGFMDNLKKNMEQNTAQNEKLRKAQMRTEQQNKEYAENFSKAQEKMSKISGDTVSEASKMAGDFKKKLEEISENENFKKFQDFKAATAEKASKKGLKFKMPEMPDTDNKVVKEIRQAAEAAEAMGTSLIGVLDTSESYMKPDPPRKRKPEWLEWQVMDADEETTTATVHKSHFWQKRMDSFKDNRLGQKFSSFSARMEDSDSALVRGAYMFTWKIKESMKLNAETAAVISEIQRMDPKFDLNEFAELLQNDIIPNILESACIGDEELLEDWCSEQAAAVLIANKKMAAKEGLHYLRHIYSLQNIEHMDCSIDDETDMPTVMFSAETQEIVALTDKEGQVIDGSLDKPMKNQMIVVLGRDMDEPDPKAAWRLLEIQSSATKMSY